MQTSKEQKENFVTGHTGTTISEINTLIFACILSLALSAQLTHRFGSRWQTTVVDISVVGLCFVLCTTVASDFLGGVVLAELALLITLRTQTRRRVRFSGAEQGQVGWLTSMRSLMTLLTLVCILAVDFPAFPRRFAKAETFGTGLMDVGVGSFVFASGFALGKCKPKAESQQQKKRDVFVRGTTVRALQLGALGLIRTITVKTADYQEHVTEYGRHWNFFLTLSVVHLFSGSRVAHQLKQTTWVLPCCGILTLCAYQLLLSTWLTDFIVNAPRSNLFSANREGLLSLIGYCGLLMVAMSCSRVLLTHRTVSTKRAVAYVAVSLLLWVGVAIIEHEIQPISRRLVNLAYCIWIVAINFTTAILCMGLHSLVPAMDAHVSPHSGSIAPALNHSMLLVFLLANLLTGAINICTNTLQADTTTAVGILASYVTALCFVARALETPLIRVMFPLRK